MRENDEDVELLLSGHLRARLDPQLGRAGAAVERHIARRRTVVFRMLSAGSALAACLVIGVMVFASLRKHSPLPPGPEKMARSTAPGVAEPDVRLERVVSWQNYDEGTVVLADNTPARRVRRQMLEQLILHDGDQQTTLQITVPQEQVLYFPLNPY